MSCHGGRRRHDHPGGDIFTYYLYRPPGPAISAPRWQAMLLEGFYLDRFYKYLIVRPYARAAEFLWKKVDDQGINRGIEGGAKGVFPALLAAGLFLVAVGG